jgi:hypothetical protein
MYSAIAELAKGAAHGLIEITFPRTATIAAISSGASWYVYEYGGTFGPGYLSKNVVAPVTHKIFGTLGLNSWASEGFIDNVAHYITPFFRVKAVAEHASWAASFGAGCAVSLVLNILHIGIIKASACWQRTKEPETIQAPPPPLHVTPGYRKEAEDANRLIEIPIYSN